MYAVAFFNTFNLAEECSKFNLEPCQLMVARSRQASMDPATIFHGPFGAFHGPKKLVSTVGGSDFKSTQFIAQRLLKL